MGIKVRLNSMYILKGGFQNCSEDSCFGKVDFHVSKHKLVHHKLGKPMNGSIDSKAVMFKPSYTRVLVAGR